MPPVHSTPASDIVLGVYDGTHDAGAALVQDGRLVAACNEERFVRRKGAGGWPTESISACLDLAGLSPEQVRRVAFAGFANPNPGLRLVRPLQRRWHLDDGQFYTESDALGDRLGQWLQFDSPFPTMHEHSRSVRAYRGPLTALLARRLRHEHGIDAAASMHDHHRCHAAAAYHTGGQRDALVVVADGLGDGLALSIWQGRGGRLSRLAAMPYPHSYGLLYATITGFLGFAPFRHEGKLVGLAARGDADRIAVPFPFEGPTHQRRFTQALGPRLRPWLERLRPYSREDVAAWLQRGLEQDLSRLLSWWLERTGLSHVVLVGGVVANVRLNQRLAALPGVESLGVFPHMGDGGLAAGAGLLAWAAGQPDAWTPQRLDHVFLGPEWSEGDIERAIADAGLRARRVQDVDEHVARLLAEGRIVARYTGRLEYGPRALGHRSILAPASGGSTDRLNVALARSEFMPFAPALLADDVAELVDGLEPVAHATRFMTVNVQARPELRRLCPEAVHVDGSLRPQVVHEDTSPGLHRVLHSYRRQTGRPGVLNTSYNMHEEPIVATPAHAVASFQAARLDALAMGPFLVAP